jgi:hypothetical protein
MIVETFFLVEEKRALGTQNFQDISSHGPGETARSVRANGG